MKAQPALQSLSLVSLTLDPLSFGLPVTMVFPTQLLLSLLLYLHIQECGPHEAEPGCGTQSYSSMVGDDLPALLL